MKSKILFCKIFFTGLNLRLQKYNFFINQKSSTANFCFYYVATGTNVESSINKRMNDNQFQKYFLKLCNEFKKNVLLQPQNGVWRSW